jgi:hypothetical protein
METDEGAAELFERILAALGEARTRALMSRIWEKSQAERAASRTRAEGKLMATFNPQIEATLLLLLWQKKNNEGDNAKESLTKAKLAATCFNAAKSLQWS